MAKLTEAQKSFIVCELAAYSTPSQVAAAVKERFDIEVPRQQIHNYNPELMPVAKKWEVLFEKARSRFLEDLSDIPISHKAVRLKKLNRYTEAAEARGNYALAATHLKQAAEESGGIYTNRREFTGKDGEPFGTPSAVVILPAKKPIEEAGGGDAKG